MRIRARNGTNRKARHRRHIPLTNPREKFEQAKMPVNKKNCQDHRRSKKKLIVCLLTNQLLRLFFHRISVHMV